MSERIVGAKSRIVRFAIGFLIIGLCWTFSLRLSAQQTTGAQKDQGTVLDTINPPPDCDASVVNSPYIPVDSWIYPAVARLYAMGYGGNVFLGMRPWTPLSVKHMLDETERQIEDANMFGDSTAVEAPGIYAAITRELSRLGDDRCRPNSGRMAIDSTYSIFRGISGNSLRDSFHLGSTIINDYGRPYESGFNNYSGVSGYISAGRFVVYARGEFQIAPSATGYSTGLASTLSFDDYIPFTDPLTGLPYKQETIPLGPIASTAKWSFLEAYASAYFHGHEFSLGKQDTWYGPAMGAGMAYSNNAENIYSFRINRIEPIVIPYFSRVFGPVRYDFMIGELNGHTYVPNPSYVANPSPSNANVINPGNPWVHIQKVSMMPMRDLEIGFQRSVIWGGQGHAPITLHSFYTSFFSFNATYPERKNGANDPGARFTAFDFNYRLPFPRNWLTLYTDSETHDAPGPLFKPTHGTFRPGIYLSHFPRVPSLDMRVEVVNTDSSHPGASFGGRYQYWELIQKQGYTNHGQIFGDWVGREGKGGQAWLTYHLSGNEWIQLGVRHQKNSKDFIPGGTTLNDVNLQVVKRIRHDMELRGDFTFERYKAPVYLPDQQTVTATTIQFTWFPERKVNF
jgi:hypothetical protein